jgi:hypothetical protein
MFHKSFICHMCSLKQHRVLQATQQHVRGQSQAKVRCSWQNQCNAMLYMIVVQERCWPLHALCLVTLCGALLCTVCHGSCWTFFAKSSQHARSCYANEAPVKTHRPVCGTRLPPASLLCSGTQRLWLVSRGGTASNARAAKANLHICEWQHQRRKG